MTREALAPLLPLILHFVNLILPAKTPNYHVVRRTDTNLHGNDGQSGTKITRQWQRMGRQCQISSDQEEWPTVALLVTRQQV